MKGQPDLGKINNAGKASGKEGTSFVFQMKKDVPEMSVTA